MKPTRTYGTGDLIYTILMIALGAVLLVGMLLILVSTLRHPEKVEGSHVGALVVIWLFIVAALVGIVGGFMRWQMIRRRMAAEARSPVPDREGKHRLDGSPANLVSLSWTIAVLALFIAVPTTQHLLHPLGVRNWGALFGPVVFVATTAFAIHVSVNHRKFGTARLEFANLPLWIGRPINGIWRAPNIRQMQRGAWLSIQCRQLSPTSDGTSVQLLWEDSHWVPSTAIPFSEDTALVPVYFDIPAACKASQRFADNRRIEWTLSIHIPCEGLDFRDSQHLVLHPNSSPVGVNDAPAGARPDYLQNPELPEDRSLKIVPLPEGGFVLNVPAGRVIGLIIFTSLGFALTLWLSWLGISGRWGCFMPVLLLLAGVFGYALVRSAFISGIVRVAHDGIEIRQSLFGITWTNEFQPGQCVGAYVRRGMISGTRQFYDVRLLLSDNRGVLLVSSLRYKRDAQWLVDLVRGVVSDSEVEPLVWKKQNSHLDYESPQ